MTELLKVEGIHDSSVASLRVSLEASLTVLEREESETYSFFYMMGLLPGGITHKNLCKMNIENLDHKLETLEQYCLITRKDEEDEVYYNMLPFMYNYAEARIPISDKQVF